MIFAFEQMSAALDLVPFAARRALDAAGCKLSLEAWRRLPIGARRALVEAGAGEVVNTRAVRAWLARHKASFDRLAPASDPPVDAAPDDLTSALGHEVADSTWRALTPLERWALVKLARKAPRGNDRLANAHREMVVVHEQRAGEPVVSTHVNRRGEVHMV